MLEQLPFPHQAHWYSLVSVSPRPETGESANVAVVIGNGRAYHLAYLDRLPRLCGLARADEIRLYEQVLRACKERVARGLDPVELAGLLGPQLRVKSAVPLYAEPSATLIDTLVQRFLAAPVAATSEHTIVRRSGQLLDGVIGRIEASGAIVIRQVRPNTLYGDRIERFTRGHRVPRLARALRGYRRDVLLDSIAIERRFSVPSTREVASRISEAFWLYDTKLRPIIRERTGTDLRLIGVIHPVPEDAEQYRLDLRDWVRDTWKHHGATVLEGTPEDVARALQEEAAWVRAAG